MASENPLTTFEDLIAFIDGFDSAPDLNEDEIMQTVFVGFTGDGVDEDPVAMAPSTELWQFLDSRTALENAMLAGMVAASPSSQTDQGCSERASVTEPVAAAAVATAAADTRKKRTKRKLREEPARPRCSHHERVKQEIQYLRSRVAELENQLSALRHGTTTLSPPQQELIDSSWKRIAHRQLEARVGSEAENARLKAELQSHFKASRFLEHALSERLDHEFVADGGKPKLIKKRISKTWEVEGLADLVNDLDATFERLDQVINETAFKHEAFGDSARSCLLRTAVSVTGEMTPYIEVMDTTITPFQPRRTSQAVWRSVSEHYLQQTCDDYGVQNIWQAGNTFAVKCRTKYTLKTNGGQEVFLNSKVVLRKYIDEESRMVLVWRAYSDGEGDLAGVYGDETGWSMVQPILGSYGHSTCGSVVRTCIHVVQRHRATNFALDPTVPQQHPSVQVFTDLVMTSSEENMLGLVKMTESLLLGKDDNFGV